MPNVARKRNEFDAATSVMEEDLLQALTQKSSGTEEDHAHSGDMEPQIEVVVEQPVAPPATAPSAPTVVANDPPRAAADPTARGSRLYVVAGIVAAVVLALDASLFVHHQRRAMQSPAAPEPLPRFMLVPLEAPSPRAPAAPVAAQPPAAAASDTTVAIATTIPEPPQALAHSHRRSHHRHSRR